MSDDYTARMEKAIAQARSAVAEINKKERSVNATAALLVGVSTGDPLFAAAQIAASEKLPTMLDSIGDSARNTTLERMIDSAGKTTLERMNDSARNANSGSNMILPSGVVMDAGTAPANRGNKLEADPLNLIATGPDERVEKQAPTIPRDDIDAAGAALRAATKEAATLPKEATTLEQIGSSMKNTSSSILPPPTPSGENNRNESFGRQ